MAAPDIDFVVTWLDPSDPAWQEQYRHYKGISGGDSSEARFRDWDLFRYWFRAVEAYAPWVHRVFLVTNGTFPRWINPNHPKLTLVRHADYIPAEYLPTFNSCTIELHMNKIPGLSEQFVYFNDDCYLNAPVDPEYYFREGLPCDCNAETVLNVPKYHPEGKFFIYMSMLADIGVLNRYFNRRETVKASPKRWYGSHLGHLGQWTSLYLTSLPGNKRFVGFNWRHVEQPFLKSVLDECWEKEPGMLSQSCTRFREEVILNPYFFRYWQFASNRFYPVRNNRSKKIRLLKRESANVEKYLADPRVTSICLNDSSVGTDNDFSMKETVQQLFEKKFPVKSEFEG